MKVVAIIPARSGSKSLKDKNIRLMNNKPMLAYSIEQALQSKLIDRVIVSTDSEEYATIAKEYGAEVPFLRPSEISQDKSLDIEVFIHALNWLKEEDDYMPDICVHLRPTHPIRNVNDIDKMIMYLYEDSNADSIRSISPAVQTPYKMWFMNDKKLEPVVQCDIPEAYNMPRQLLPKAYMQNACIDVVRSKTILEKKSMTGDCILGYEINYDYDIDTESDFLNAEQAQLVLDSIVEKRKLTISCDIDGVLAYKTHNNDYSIATPMMHNIKMINYLYSQGHEIILFTARGFKTSIDWSEITKKQMDTWGVKYSQLRFGKQAADVYIDDHNMNLNDLIYLLTGDKK